MERLGNKDRTLSMWYYIISAAMIIYVVYGLAIYWFKLTFILPNPLQYWQFSEWLINFEGGFVRRGLLGEVLLDICRVCDVSPIYIISYLCLGIYIALFIFYKRKFKRRGLCWWFLCGPLTFGFVDDLIRKDFLLIGVVLMVSHLLRNRKSSVLSHFVVFILAIWGMLVHEAFIFWGAPLIVLLLWGNGSKISALILSVCLILEFLILCYFKGNREIEIAIIQSWNDLLDGEHLWATHYNSIGALNWNVKEAFEYHLKENIGYDNYCTGLVGRPIIWIFAYYLLINFLYVFKKDDKAFLRKDQDHLGALFLILTVTMLPLFTFLSSDPQRLYQYMVMTITGIYIILDRDVLGKIIPIWLLRLSKRINQGINSFLPPSKGWVMTVFLLWTCFPGGFSYRNMLTHSVAGKLSVLIGAIVDKILF